MEATIQLELPAMPSSVGEARRAVERLLVSEGAAPELIDQAVLLVSEVVTNAVLHAGTELVVSAKATAEGAHVRVVDFSPVLPSPRHHGEEASTGRGMLLVEAMSTSFGTFTEEGAKTVWFTVGNIEAEDPDLVTEFDESTCAVIRFPGLHVGMARATLAYGEAVLRELALVNPPALGGTGSWTVPRFSLGPLWAQLDEAVAAGRDVVDAEVPFPRDEAEHCLERLALVEEADRLARDGKLLTVPAVPEIGHYRLWIYRQIHDQAHGAQPQAWTEPPTALPAVIHPVELGADDISRLADVDTPVVLADDGNRILFANAAAEHLLGWEDEGLAGARLIEIVPREHRLAHLAGFVRYQVTGEARLLGSTIAVPVLRLDGAVVRIALTLSAESTFEGKRVFRATLVPIEDHETGDA